MLQEAVAVAGDWLEAQKLDIRVGKVISAELHPDAERYTSLVPNSNNFVAFCTLSLSLQSVRGAGRCGGGGTSHYH